MKKLFEKAKIISGYSVEEAVRRLEILQDRVSDENVREYDKYEYLLEAMMLTQVIMLKAEAKRLEELQSEVDEDLERAWVQVPRGDDMKYWLNKYGKRLWKLKSNEAFTAIRSYYWCDRVICLDPDRKVILDTTFTEFMVTADYYKPVLPEPGQEIKPQS